MEGPPLGPGGEDITWPDQVAPRGRKASSTRKIKPQTSNLLFTAVHARCVALHVQCRGPLSSCSTLYMFGVFCCLHGVLYYLVPVQRFARSVCCSLCEVSWATWLLFTVVHARCVVSRPWCPGPLDSCSPPYILEIAHHSFGGSSGC